MPAINAFIRINYKFLWLATLPSPSIPTPRSSHTSCLGCFPFRKPFLPRSGKHLSDHRHTLGYCKAQKEHLAWQRPSVTQTTHMHQGTQILTEGFSSPFTTQPRQAESSSHLRHGIFWKPEASFKASRALGSLLQGILPPHLHLLPAPNIPHFNINCISLYSKQTEQGRAARK